MACNLSCTSDIFVKNVLKICVIILYIIFQLNSFTNGSDFSSQINNNSIRESKKLFGGYRITPRFCRPTRVVPGVEGGPSICMFNHECAQRNGHVVGACMDGFLFGACCQLPADASPSPSNIPADAIIPQDNTVVLKEESTSYKPLNSDLTENEKPVILETAPNDVIVQISNEDSVSFKPSPSSEQFISSSYPDTAETVLFHYNGSEVINKINGEEFTKPGVYHKPTEKATTRIEASTKPFYYPSSTNYFTLRPITPSDNDKYVLVPTITKPGNNNKNQSLPEMESIVNIIQMLDDQAPNRIIPTTNKIESKTSTTPGYYPTSTTSYYSPTNNYLYTSTSSRPSYVHSSTPKPPSTSYVFSTTIPPRPGFKPASNKPSTSYVYSSTPFTIPKPTTSSQSSTIYTQPSTSYIYSSTNRPITTNKYSTTNKKGTTSKKPTTYTTTLTPPYNAAHYSTSQYPSPSPPPTVIVLGPLSESNTSPVPASYDTIISSTPRPKPVSQVTINNMIQSSNTIHLGANGEKHPDPVTTSERPVPTVLITPKPSASTVNSYWTQQTPNHSTILIKKPTTLESDGSTLPQEYYMSSTVAIGSIPADELVNFPPVRNPNLNLSVSTTETEFDITTPAFIEDDALNDKVESFVNKIIQSLQGPFDDLRNVVYNNKTAIVATSTTTTKKPAKKPITTTKKPAKITTTQKTTTRKPVTTKKPAPPRRSTTKKPTTIVTTRKPTTTLTTKRTKPTRRPTTTKAPTTVSITSSSEESSEEDYYEETQQQQQQQVPDYKRLCGVRPLMRDGRIVGGKGATFGEWPWQVLVKESTWLGLFTKNKCGGVLISNRYVITAAHCQPGFLASLVAVLGEFDISGEVESKRSVTRPVKRVIVHRQYNAATFENDLALLELESPVEFDTHIVPICLPPDGADYTGRMATVTGWGRLKYSGGVPSILQEVQVPIMENSVCQEMFHTAGHSKVILDSFLCAGYANGAKDSCEGDSGGPLVLQRPDGRWELAGTVSHGIKCAAPYMPGVYMRMTYYKPWITQITGVH